MFTCNSIIILNAPLFSMGLNDFSFLPSCLRYGLGPSFIPDNMMDIVWHQLRFDAVFIQK